MVKKKDGPSKTRQQIDEAMQKVERDQLLQSARRRLEIAMAGVKANEKHKYVDAVKQYQAYLKVLEEVKGAPEGGLVPSHFDQGKEMGELLLLVGVYWDLAKIFDRTKTADKYLDFKSYLDKFLLFSRGMPHETVCKEMLRKYLRREKPEHSKEFRDAYKILSKDKCFIATALVDVIDEETLPRLRVLRDEKLAHSPAGRAFIATYYKVGPPAAAWVARAPLPLRRLLGALVNRIARQTKVL